MNDQSDSQLLVAWAETRSEPAFAELVRRHIDFVYSAALRMVCDPHLAQDVTQGAFVALAQNARQLTDSLVLSSWLHRTAQNLAANTIRTDVRRRAREQEAATMNHLLATKSDAPWENIAPHLDAALGELSDPDRDAVLLRYFERKTAREMAQILGTNEDAAQKRVNRAVDRLREFFVKRGVTVGASGLVVVISTNAVQAAPIGLTISAIAAAKGSAATASTSTLIKGALKLMAWSKAKTAIVVGAGVLLAAGTATVVVTEFKPVVVDDKWFDIVNFPKAPRNLLVIRPTKFPADHMAGITYDPIPTPAEIQNSASLGEATERIAKRELGFLLSLEDLVAHAYVQKNAISSFALERMIFSEPWPEQRYDYVITASGNVSQHLQALIKKQLGVQARKEMREQDVLRLKLKTTGARGLKATAGGKAKIVFNYPENSTPGTLCCTNQPVSTLTAYLESVFGVPVTDGTGLNGNFDFVADYTNVGPKAPADMKESAQKTVRASLLNQLGLELVPGQEKIEMLVVERVKK